jgi:hypothetical protein
MYRLTLLALFVALASYRPHRSVWAVVSAVCAAELGAWTAYGHNDVELYVIQSTAALLGGIALCKVGTRLALYQAAIYAATLLAYLALALDVAAGSHFLIYNYYEAVIYGLVAGQLIGIFPTVRASLILYGAGPALNMGSLQGDKKR